MNLEHSPETYWYIDKQSGVRVHYEQGQYVERLVNIIKPRNSYVNIEGLILLLIIVILILVSFRRGGIGRGEEAVTSGY